MKCRTAIPVNGSSAGPFLTFTGATRDVSRNGLLLELDPDKPVHLQPGVIVRVDIELPLLASNIARSLHCEGVLVRLEPAAPKRIAVAIAVSRMEFCDQVQENEWAANSTAPPVTILM